MPHQDEGEHKQRETDQGVTTSMTNHRKECKQINRLVVDLGVGWGMSVGREEEGNKIEIEICSKNGTDSEGKDKQNTQTHSKTNLRVLCRARSCLAFYQKKGSK
jgi:hypothetical protein